MEETTNKPINLYATPLVHHMQRLLQGRLLIVEINSMNMSIANKFHYFFVDIVGVEITPELVCRLDNKIHQYWSGYKHYKLNNVLSIDNDYF